jgi:hypothetical protein
MSLASLVLPTIKTVAELTEWLGDIPPERVRIHPWPGTATESDVLAAHARDKAQAVTVYTAPERATVLDES